MPFVYFDVAGTLLHKPSVFDAMLKVFDEAGYKVDRNQLILRHKILSEVIKFPDKTSRDFYSYFNAELIRSLGFSFNEKLVEALFAACTYKEWVPFDDTAVLREIVQDKGIISNWDTSLKIKINSFFPGVFSPVLSSMEEGVAKPDIEIFCRAIDQCGYAPSEVYYIGDSIKMDIEPAQSLGINAILIDRSCLYVDYNINRIESLHQIIDVIS